DFRVDPDKITLGSGTWPPASETSTWDPSGSTSINARVTTNAVTQVGPTTAPQSGTNVPILSFQITPGASDTLNSVAVNYTGTATSDITAVRLYQESSLVPGTFGSLTDTLVASTTSFTGTVATLTPSSPVALTGGASVQFYVVVDLAAAAVIGHTVDFDVLTGGITLGWGTWPPASELTTWHPAGNSVRRR